jgi:hypothetical protein
MFGFGKEKLQVAVAVAYDEQRKGYFVVFNPRWRGYAFPHKRWPEVRVLDDVEYRRICEETALSAFEEDLGRSFPDAQTIWIDYLEVEGVSGRTGKRKRYSFDIVWIGPHDDLPDDGLAAPCGYLSREQILGNQTIVTWSTREILRELLEEQQVAVGVICRRVHGERQYLLTLNRYGRYFFPAKRLRRSISARRALIAEFRVNANFMGHIDVGGPVQAGMTQNTVHLGMREYQYHLFPMFFPEVNLSAASNRLEDALAKAGIVFRWVSEHELTNPSPQISDTISGIIGQVLALPSGDA